jgi:hypothetical protein
MHLPLPDVPEGVRSAIHGVRERTARRPALDALTPIDLLETNVAERNFCSACGTPLTYHRVESGSMP